jgi:hypothetical protein
MAKRKLTIAISEYDSDIKNVVVPALQGGLDVTYKKYSKLPDLGEYTGDSVYPLILVGHANGVNFKTGMALADRVDGIIRAKKLLTNNLKASTFPFCLIAGCSGAEDKKRGFYISIGKELSIPTVASSTPIKISRTAGDISLIPQNSGIWRVFFQTVMNGMSSKQRGDVKLFVLFWPVRNSSANQV